MEAVTSIIIINITRKVAAIAAIDIIQRKETVVVEAEAAINSISTDSIIIITRDLVAIVAKSEVVVKAPKSTDRIHSIKQCNNWHVKPINRLAMQMNKLVKPIKKPARLIRKPV